MTDRISRIGSAILATMLWPFVQSWRGICAVGRLILWPLRVTYRDVGRAILAAMLWPFRQIWRRICSVGTLIKLFALAIYHSPVSVYRATIRRRDWAMAKIEYLQAESTKWRTAFSIVKSPYSFLRMMGLSPQMAIGLLAVGSTAGTGVIVSETVFANARLPEAMPGIIPRH